MPEPGSAEAIIRFSSIYGAIGLKKYSNRVKMAGRVTIEAIKLLKKN